MKVSFHPVNKKNRLPVLWAYVTTLLIALFFLLLYLLRISKCTFINYNDTYDDLQQPIRSLVLSKICIFECFDKNSYHMSRYMFV